MPTVLPRRQTTSQLRPVLASRENASRNLAGSVLASSMVSFAPDVERFCTTHGRAAKPPSSVIQPGWCTDLRASRFLVPGAIELFLTPTFLSRAALETVARMRDWSGLFAASRGPDSLRKNPDGSDLPAPANATIRSLRRRLDPPSRWWQAGSNPAPKALIYLTFCSLRLSVRTPPFHGGESGSIPLGSASAQTRPETVRCLWPLPA